MDRPMCVDHFCTRDEMKDENGIAYEERKWKRMQNIIKTTKIESHKADSILAVSLLKSIAFAWGAFQTHKIYGMDMPFYMTIFPTKSS